MTERIAWVLNLDAELELIDPTYRRSDRMRAHVRSLARELAPRIRAATGTEPVLLDDGVAGRDRAPGCARGDAWCPTPRALERLRSAGVALPDAAPVDVLRAVNHRAFAARLGVLLPGARFAATVDEVFAALASAPERAWLLKRPLGFSGRMRKEVVPARLDAAARTWIDASMTGYGCGLMVEPRVDRILDVSVHGRIVADGTVRRGVPVVVRCDAAGAFTDARVAQPGDLAADELRALDDAFDLTSAALRRAGYAGPFGIDAFRWRTASGAVRFHALSELNARYTMAWWSGMKG